MNSPSFKLEWEITIITWQVLDNRTGRSHEGKKAHKNNYDEAATSPTHGAIKENLAAFIRCLSYCTGLNHKLTPPKKN